MNIQLIAIGDKMPRWVRDGFDEYAKRLPAECRLRLLEISAGKRGRNADTERIRREEGGRLIAAIPKNSLTIALEVGGQSWSTEQLARRIDEWMHDGRDVALLVGGPEGLDEAARQAAQQLWSLSPLTLPHPLVRIVIAEQLYRAWSILRNHPYHRA